MKKFETSLLREKFVLHDSGAGMGKDRVVALSSTIVAGFNGGECGEIFTVRAQNMHSCLRMAARLMQSFQAGGALMKRQPPYDWAGAWEASISEYETTYNEQRWIAIYHQGKPVFAQGEHHSFLDVLENCHAGNGSDYERSIALARDTFKKMGKTVKIDYDGNIALNVAAEDNSARIGVIFRGPDKTRTFNFSVSARNKHTLNIPQCLGAAAAFLEGIQLAFMIGMNEEKLRTGKIARNSQEDRQTREARQRLARLNAEISGLESACEVRYRPERPDFQHILMDAEKLAKATLPRR